MATELKQIHVEKVIYICICRMMPACLIFQISKAKKVANLTEIYQNVEHCLIIQVRTYEMIAMTTEFNSLMLYNSASDKTTIESFKIEEVNFILIFAYLNFAFFQHIEDIFSPLSTF